MAGTISLTISSEIGQIPKISAALEEAMQSHAFAEEEILDTQLAVEEAITNSIVHGYRGKTGTVMVIIHVSRGIAEIQIEDNAEQFDPLSIPEPDLAGDLEERHIGGLGIFLIRQVMDEVVYRYEDGKNILSLVKRKGA